MKILNHQNANEKPPVLQARRGVTVDTYIVLGKYLVRKPEVERLLSFKRR